ncbi:MAG: hypothetical protein ACTS1X_02885 [Parasphingopyxis sp.]|uniref:hypothetical protein n=1 Tax=Parasphingopyxis sp. TaxID=1920299 RepID=UPI003FA03173
MIAALRALPWPTRIALVALGAMLVWTFGEFVLMAVRAVAYRYELDYGEGIVWHQARQLFTEEAFGDIHGFPAIVYHYTPFFHLLSNALAGLGLDGLAAGRLVSLLSTALFALFAGLICLEFARRDGGRGWVAIVCAAIAGLLIFATFPVQIWAPLMRVDMLAFALSFAGFYFALRALDKSWLIHCAALAFVLAVFTKQTMIAAPAAAFLVLLLVRPRLAIAGIATCVVAGLVALGVLAWLTDGGFLRHVFLYNVNRFDPDRLGWILDIAGGHALIVAVGALGFASRLPQLRTLWRARRSADADPQIAARTMLGLYVILTTAMLLLVGKSGSSVNYFIEWLGLVCIYCGLAVHDRIATSAEAEKGQARRPFGPEIVAGALAIQLLILPTLPYADIGDPERNRELAALEAEIRAADRPVISDDMVVVIRAGQPVLWESAIFAELASTGVWDEAPFVALIGQRHFAFFVTAGERGGERFDERYNPAVADAIYRAYPQRAVLAGRTIHRPE